MPTRQRLSAGVLLLSGLLSLEARAQDTDCLGSLGAVEVGGNLNVAVSCRLTGTVVMGKVTLFAGGSLVARDARINGSVEGRRGNFVDVDRSTIGGDCSSRNSSATRARFRGLTSAATPSSARTGPTWRSSTTTSAVASRSPEIAAGL